MLAGLFGSIIVDATKALNATKRARKAIYEELADIYYSIVLLGREMGEPYIESALEDMQTETFDFYYEHGRETVFRIQGWQNLRDFANYIKLARREFRDRTSTTEEILGGLEAEFEIRRKHGLMDKKLLDHYVEQRRWRKDRNVPT